MRAVHSIFVLLLLASITAPAQDPHGAQTMGARAPEEKLEVLDARITYVLDLWLMMSPGVLARLWHPIRKEEQVLPAKCYDVPPEETEKFIADYAKERGSPDVDKQAADALLKLSDSLLPALKALGGRARAKRCKQKVDSGQKLREHAEELKHPGPDTFRRLAEQYERISSQTSVALACLRGERQIAPRLGFPDIDARYHRWLGEKKPECGLKKVLEALKQELAAGAADPDEGASGERADLESRIGFIETLVR
jgi:hypothetical protein